jgi:DNA polymerase-1
MTAEELDLAVWSIFHRMSRKGIRVDHGKLEALRDEVDRLAVDAKERVEVMAGRELNPNSGDQVAEVLTDMGYKGKMTPKGDRMCTDEQSLKLIDDPIIEPILEYRGHIKLLSAFVQPTFEAARGDGRVHPHWKLTQVRSGRVACGDERRPDRPNLMAFPAREEIGLKVRGCFVADPGHVMFSVDYSQIEPRLVAALSGDVSLKAVYAEGRDLYVDAQERLSISTRDISKTLTLGIFYGLEGKGLSIRLKGDGVDIDENACNDLIRRWFEAYPKVAEYKHKIVQLARSNEGRCQTYGGRVRTLPALYFNKRRWPGSKLCEEAERQAFNHVIQGTAQEFMKRGMLAADSPSFDPLLQMHDELVGQVHEDLVEALVPCIAEDMEHHDVLGTGMSLTTDFETGPDWASLKG